MPKKVLLGIIAAFIIIAILSFTLWFINKEPEPKEISIELMSYSSGSNEHKSSRDTTRTFSSIIEVSTDCFVGKFIECKKYDGFFEYEFEVTEKVFGLSEDNTVRVRVLDHLTQSVNSYTFKKGHEYLLTLRKSDSLFIDYPKYSFMGYIVLDFSNINNAKWKDGTIKISEGASKTDIINHVNSLSNKVGIATTSDARVFRTEDEETVIKNCDLILKIKPRILITDGVLANSSSYFCEVTDCLKGTYSTNEDGVVIIRTLKHALDSGEECIIALSTKNQDFSYDQASPICIFDADDSEMEAKIKEWLSEKKTP